MIRIHICGIYGSGKSTLAIILSRKFHVPHYSLDDIKYEVKYSKIRTVEERMKRVGEISRYTNWITEGTWSNYAEEVFKKSDVVILMQTPFLVCCYRILKRYFLRKREENDTLLGAFALIKNTYRYYHKDVPVSRIAHERLIRKYNKKVIVIKNKSDFKKFLDRVDHHGYLK